MNNLITGTLFRKVKNYILPPVAERMRTGFASLDWAVQQLFQFDLSYAMNDGTSMVVQSLTIDNSANALPVVFVSDKTLQFTRQINAGEIRTFNIPAIDPSYFTLECDATSGSTNVYLYNFPSLPDTQQVNMSFGGVPSPAFTSAVHEVTTVSTVFAPLDAARKYLMIQNNDAAGVVYLAFGRAATANDYQIQPGGYYEPNSAPGNSINLLSSIASNPNVVIIEG